MHQGGLESPNRHVQSFRPLNFLFHMCTIYETMNYESFSHVTLGPEPRFSEIFLNKME